MLQLERLVIGTMSILYGSIQPMVPFFFSREVINDLSFIIEVRL
jgi:hypothetical protein